MTVTAFATYPTVDIIIPHFRRRDMLERCLDSLEMCRYPAMRIVVVDNGGSQAGLVFLVKRYRNTTLLRLPKNRGYAGGCNAGLKNSTADFVVFMNDDTEHDPLWLDYLVSAALEDERIGALQPKILSLQGVGKGKKLFDYAGAAGGMIDRLGYPWCLGRTFGRVEPDKGQFDVAQDIFWASGVAMFVRREVVEKVGGFDEEFFMHMEEIDLAWRMQLAGYTIRSVPSSIVLHEGGASLPGGSAEKCYLNHRNNIAMILKNSSAAGLLWLIPLRILLDMVASLFYLTELPGGIKKTASVWRALTDNVRGIGHTFKKRREVQRSRVVSDRTIFRHSPFSQITSR